MVLRRYHEGLEYMKGLGRREAAAALQTYGKVRRASPCVGVLGGGERGALGADWRQQRGTL